MEPPASNTRSALCRDSRPRGAAISQPQKRLQINVTFLRASIWVPATPLDPLAHTPFSLPGEQVQLSCLLFHNCSHFSVSYPEGERIPFIFILAPSNRIWIMGSCFIFCHFLLVYHFVLLCWHLIIRNVVVTLLYWTTTCSTLKRNQFYQCCIYRRIRVASWFIHGL